MSNKTIEKNIFISIKYNKNVNKSELLINNLKTNIYPIIKDNINYYNDFYDCLYSKKLNTNTEKKTDCKKVKYQILFSEDASRITKDNKNRILD